MIRFFFFLFLVFFFLPTSTFSQKILWEKSYGGLKSEYLFDALPTPDYGFLLIGSSLSDKSGNKKDKKVNDLDFWLWKMDEHGGLDWQRSFGGTGSDWLQSVDLTSDGGFILGGTTTSSIGGVKEEASRGKEDIWVIKLNAKGDLEWQKTIGGSGRDELKKIIAIKGGGYLIGGSSDSRPIKNNSEEEGEKFSEAFGNMDYWVIKIDIEGAIEWEKTFGGIYRDELQSLIQTKDGGFLIGGTSNSPISGNKIESNYGEGDYWIIKLDKEGNEEWQRSVGGEKDDRLSVLIETRSGLYIVGGSSSSKAEGRKTIDNGKGTDFWIVAIDQNGRIIWQETYDFGQYDILTSIFENEDESLLIGGYAQSERTRSKKTDNEGINDYIVLKVDSEGKELWRKSVGSSGTDILKKAIEIYDGSYLLAGMSSGENSKDRKSGFGGYDFWVVKLKDEEKEDKKREEGLKAWPNPTQNYTNIIVNHDFEKATVYIYDILGREIQQFKAEQRTIPVNLEAQSEGVYIIRVETNVKKQNIKVIRGLK